MMYRVFWVFLCVCCLTLPTPGLAQISHEARIEIIRTVLADQAAARIGLPFGNDGIDLSESGEVDKGKLQREIQKNGQSIEPGKVVKVTDITFDDNRIILELDGAVYTLPTSPYKGSPTNPFSLEDMCEKFARYAGQVLTRRQLDDIIDIVTDLEDVPDMAKLASLISVRVGSGA